MSKLVNICLIGTGRAGMIHGKNFARRIENAKLIALCDPSKESLELAQKEVDCQYLYEDYREVMETPEIDAVVIVTPTVHHKEIALAAAAAKKHILCEKPLAMDEAECLEMIQAAEENQVKLQVGLCDVSMQVFRKQKESWILVRSVRLSW